MPKKPRKPPAAGAACRERGRLPSNVVRSPGKRGRPTGSIVDPMVRIMRQTHDPNYLAAMRALAIRDEHEAAGVRITRAQAIDQAIAEFPVRFGVPRKLRMTVRTNAAGQRVLNLKGKPAALNRDKVVELLVKGLVNRTTLHEFRRWQPHVAALPRKITR